jgi:hypothetical protein
MTNPRSPINPTNPINAIDAINSTNPILREFENSPRKRPENA